MNNYAVMPKDDYVAACNAIREKTGDTEAIKSGELVNKVSEVHDAGAVSILQSSKYMYPTVSGEAIQIDDMADVSFKARIMKRNKNLLTAQQVYQGCYEYSEEVLDGRNCVRTTSGNTLYKYLDIFKPNTQYIVSFYEKSVNYGNAKGPNIIFSFKYTDGTYEHKYAKQDSANNHNTDWTYLSYTSAVGKTVEAVGVSAGQYLIYTYVDIDTFQFEEGATATPYTPYIEDLDAVKVRKYGKNLFTTVGRIKTHLGAYENTTQRTITENCYYVGLAGNNYFEPYNVGDYDMSEPNCIRINLKQYAYGIGFNFRVNPNEVYTLSVQSSTDDKAQLRFSFYTKDGVWLSMIVGDNQKVTATVPDNGYWMVALLSSSVINTDIYINDIMLEMSNNATEYEPYQEPVEVDKTFESTPNTITLIPDTSGVTLECQYVRNIDKCLKEQ